MSNALAMSFRASDFTDPSAGALTRLLCPSLCENWSVRITFVMVAYNFSRDPMVLWFESAFNLKG